MEQEKIIDFIEGSLPVEEEETLLTELSYNTVLRDEFKAFMKINGSLNEMKSLYTPSSNVTFSVFNKLGYSIPVETITTPLTGSGSWFTGIRLLSYAAVGVVSSIITFFAAGYIYKSVVTSPPVEKHYVSQPYSAPNLNNNKNNLEIHKNPVNLRERKYIKDIASLPAQPYMLEIVQRDMPQKMPVNKLNLSKFNYNDFANLNNSSYNLIGKRNDISFQSSVFTSDRGFRLEARNSVNWHLARPAISPANSSLFVNDGISVFYSLTDRLKLGLDIRDETFSTTYEGTENGKTYIYQQQPDLTSYGLALRYSFINKNKFSSFMQLYYGFNRAGTIIRPGIGIDYSIYSDIGILLFFDYSVFSFHHQNQTFTTSKAGLNYGIFYRF